MKKIFPPQFLWGVGYSAHQVEGNNTNNDWWQWEQEGNTRELSGIACDSWHRYPEDHTLAQQLGCNAFRLSLEWSRIEPKEGEFDQSAIEHYRSVLKDIRSKGMQRVVTLWHYTMPIWFAHRYGWHHKNAPELFARYAKKVVETLGSEIDLLTTMNEPRLPLNRGYLLGNRPPGKKNPVDFFRARRNMVRGHQLAYDAVKAMRPDVPIGITQFCNDFDFGGKARWLGVLTEWIEDFYNWYFFKQIGVKQDYIGINYYVAVEVNVKPPFYTVKTEQHKWTEMQWGVYPEGLYEITMDAHKKFKLPIYIMENGAADTEDRLRADYIHDYLLWLHKAVEAGADVRGYFYWSLIDNYEWEDGFHPRFGLVEMDYKTLERRPRRSYSYYQKVIRERGIEEA